MQISISNLEKALITLDESYEILSNNKNDYLTTVLEDAVIKRFEYTLEISKKIMKKVLKKFYDKQEEELTVNNIFRFMYGYNYISDWERWRTYHEKRNTTAHEYNLEKSRKLLGLIPDFLRDTKELIKNLKEKLPC